MPRADDAHPAQLLRRQSRRRWLLVACGTLTFTLLVIANVMNHHDYVAAWTGDGYWLRACRGGIEVNWVPNSGYSHRLPGFHSGRMHVPLEWLPSRQLLANGWSVFVPFWIPAALVLTCTLGLLAIIAKRRFQRRGEHCKRCGYDRRGLTPDAICPECAACVKTHPPPGT